MKIQIRRGNLSGQERQLLHGRQGVRIREDRMIPSQVARHERQQ